MASHPPTVERIGAAVAFAAQGPGLGLAGERGDLRISERSPTQGARRTTTQFWPPKPNALAAATRTSALRAVSGT